MIRFKHGESYESPKNQAYFLLSFNICIWMLAKECEQFRIGKVENKKKYEY